MHTSSFVEFGWPAFADRAAIKKASKHVWFAPKYSVLKPKLQNLTDMLTANLHPLVPAPIERIRRHMASRPFCICSSHPGPTRMCDAQLSWSSKYVTIFHNCSKRGRTSSYHNKGKHAASSCRPFPDVCIATATADLNWPRLGQRPVQVMSKPCRLLETC